MSRTLDRITAQAYANHTIEYSVDGEPVSMSTPLDLNEGTLVPFYVERPVIRPLSTGDALETYTVENWVGFEVIEFHSGLIHYAQSAKGADALAYQIAQTFLLRTLINAGKLD